MKIISVCLQSGGGMVHYQSEIYNTIANNNTVHIFTRVKNPQKYFRNVDFHHCDVGTTKLQVIKNTVQLKFIPLIKKILRLNPAVIHFTSSHEWNLPIVAFLKVLSNIKIVYTLHDPTSHGGAIDITGIMESLLLFFCDGVIIHSHKLVNFPRRLMVLGELTIIPHGFYSHFPTTHSVDKPQENIILFFGRIVPYKGLDLLVDTLPAIEKSLPNWKVLVAGGGYSEKLNTARGMNKNLEVQNHFHSDTNLALLIQKSKIIVLPYKSATQSGAILLAQAFSRPVIATDVGAISDLITHLDTGYFTDYNKESLLAAIVELATNQSLRQSIAKNALEKNYSKFNIERIGLLHIEFFKSLIDAK